MRGHGHTPDVPKGGSDSRHVPTTPPRHPQLKGGTPIPIPPSSRTRSRGPPPYLFWGAWGGLGGPGGFSGGVWARHTPPFGRHRAGVPRQSRCAGFSPRLPHAQPKDKAAPPGWPRRATADPFPGPPRGDTATRGGHGGGRPSWHRHKALGEGGTPKAGTRPCTAPLQGGGPHGVRRGPQGRREGRQGGVAPVGHRMDVEATRATRGREPPGVTACDKSRGPPVFFGVLSRVSPRWAIGVTPPCQQCHPRCGTGDTPAVAAKIGGSPECHQALSCNRALGDRGHIVPKDGHPQIPCPCQLGVPRAAEPRRVMSPHRNDVPTSK